MPGVNLKKMRRAHEEQQKFSDDIKFEKGETLCYVHPMCRGGADEWEPTAELNYVPITLHYGLKDRRMAASLDPDINPILTHPWIKELLKSKRIRLPSTCPIQEALNDGRLDAQDCRAQTKYIWGITPLAHRLKSSQEWTALDNIKPGTILAGKQIYDGIMEVFFDEGDITDPAAAVLIRVIKSGRDMNTKYVIKPDPDTAKSKYAVPKKLRAKLDKALMANGDCDLFKAAFDFIKSPADLEPLINGAAVGTEPDDDDDDEDEKPRHKGRKSAPEPEPDEADDEDDEDDEEDVPPPKPAKSSKSKPAKPPVDEDEDDEDDEEADDEDDEDDAPPPKPASKSKPTKSKAPDPEPDEDDEDEDDEEDEPPAKPAKASKPAKAEKPAKPVKATKAKPEEEDEDLGLADLEDELSDDEDDEDDEDEAPPKKPVKSAKKGK